MVHIYFAAYAILMIIAAITQFSITLLWRHSGGRLPRYLFYFHAMLLIAILSDYAFYYFSPNVLSINPLASDIGMDIVRKSMPFFMFLVVSTCSYPFLPYFLYCSLAAISHDGKPAASATLLYASVAVALWLFLSNCAVPILFNADARSTRIVCMANDTGLLALQALVVLAICLYWLRNRTRGTPEASLGDRLTLAMVIVVAVSGVRALGTAAFQGGFGWTKGARDAFLFVTDRPFALCLLVDASIALYAREQLAGIQRQREGEAGALARYEIPEGFNERYKLTPREIEIARLIAAGLANKEISGRLGISYNTVKNHVASLFVKLGIESRFELIARIVEFSAERPVNRD